MVTALIRCSFWVFPPRISCIDGAPIELGAPHPEARKRTRVWVCVDRRIDPGWSRGPSASSLWRQNGGKGPFLYHSAAAQNNANQWVSWRSNGSRLYYVTAMTEN